MDMECLSTLYSLLNAEDNKIKYLVSPLREFS
jgi:hypothetical protein